MSDVTIDKSSNEDQLSATTITTTTTTTTTTLQVNNNPSPYLRMCLRFYANPESYTQLLRIIQHERIRAGEGEMATEQQQQPMTATRRISLRTYDHFCKRFVRTQHFVGSN